MQGLAQHACRNVLWRAVDHCSIGGAATGVDIADVDVTASVVALHPSFANYNQRQRREPEEEMIRRVLQASPHAMRKRAGAASAQRWRCVAVRQAPAASATVRD